MSLWCASGTTLHGFDGLRQDPTCTCFAVFSSVNWHDNEELNVALPCDQTFVLRVAKDNFMAYHQSLDVNKHLSITIGLK